MIYIFTIALFVYSIGIIGAYRRGVNDGFKMSKSQPLIPIIDEIKHEQNKKRQETAQTQIEKKLQEQDRVIEEFIMSGGLTRGNN